MTLYLLMLIGPGYLNLLNGKRLTFHTIGVLKILLYTTTPLAANRQQPVIYLSA
jgi:hypothetical protein